MSSCLKGEVDHVDHNVRDGDASKKYNSALQGSSRKGRVLSFSRLPRGIVAAGPLPLIESK